MAEPVKKDDALAAAVREAFQRHMENARLASLATKPSPLALEGKRPVLAASTIRQIELRAEPQPPAAEAGTTRETSRSGDEPPRLPSIDEAPLPALPPIDIGEPLAMKPADSMQADRGSSEPKLVDVLPRAPKDESSKPGTGVSLAPPSPANDRPMQLATERLRERQISLTPQADRTRRGEAPQPLDRESTDEALPAGRTNIAPPVSRPRMSARRDAANSNQGVHFGTGSRREVQPRSSSRWIVLAALGAASLLCIGIGGYVWINASAPSSKSGAVEGRATPVGAPAPAVASNPVPAPAAPTQKVVASLPSANDQASEAAPKSDASRPESPVSAHTVQTTTITLDAIDLAIQDAKERLNLGDVAAARLILERFKEGGDPRALFALAETFDPSVVKDASLADPKQAQALYEAAGRAGSAASADRLARLQLEKQN